ncbi:MAG: RNA polymerase sigma factor [Ruminococcaceae bacterium]|nr:RNA polymerase sigma factor [Oscillospiraceae bacterium]
MEDKQIIDLYMQRNESAISETASSYGGYLSKLAFNILYSKEDSEECVNDTYMKAWNVIPPNSPKNLRCFLGKITRNLALNIVEMKNAFKRGNGQVYAALEELEECIPSGESVEEKYDEKALISVINGFMKTLPRRTRVVFVKKYWYMASINEIAALTGLTESNVKAILMRTREKLRKTLQREGIML